MFLKNAFIILVFLFKGIAFGQVSFSGCYISGALINPTNTAGCGNSGTNYCDIASLYVPAFSPTACGTFTSSGGSTYNFVTAYTLPGGCTASIVAEFKKRAYLGIATGSGCDNAGMDGSPDKLFIKSSGGTIASQGSTLAVNVGTCGAYPVLGTYTSATPSINPGCSNADGIVAMVITGGSFSVQGASDRADEFITYTINFSGTCGTGCSSVLPIELTDFYGEVNGESVRLYWRVASERNTTYYTVEKSLDMIKWEEMGKLESSKSSNVNITYQIADNNPIRGINYYRLTDYNIDGSYTKHKAISVNYLNKNNNFSYTQNDDELIISSNNSIHNASINLLDVTGRIIKKMVVDANSPAFISKRDIGKGLFLLQCETYPQLGVSKIIVN